MENSRGEGKPESPWARRLVVGIDRFAVHVAQHWLRYACLALGLYIGIPFLAPLALQAGLTPVADAIYGVYQFTCHQLSFRSWFLFGEQPAYTVDELQHLLGVATDPHDLFFWRAVVGNPQIGFKVALCERDIAIYGSMMVALLAFAAAGRRARPLSLLGFILLSLPMAIDGGWQLLSYTPLTMWIPFHESTPVLRTVTGALFGAGAVWLTAPYVEAAMRDLRRDAAYQLARAQMQAPSAE